MAGGQAVASRKAWLPENRLTDGSLVRWWRANGLASVGEGPGWPAMVSCGEVLENNDVSFLLSFWAMRRNVRAIKILFRLGVAGSLGTLGVRLVCRVFVNVSGDAFDVGMAVDCVVRS